MRSLSKSTWGRSVSFELVYGRREAVLPLRFESHIEERLVALLNWQEPGQAVDRTRADLANRIAEAVTMVIEGTSLLPTEKQIKYAVSVARELSIQLPAEVLQFRDAMTAFLDLHAEAYRRRKAYGGSTASTHSPNEATPRERGRP